MRAILLIILFATSAFAQAAPRGKPLGSWDVEYDHTTLHMHGEPTHRHERGHMTLRAEGDSLFGELAIGDSATASRSVLRGKSTKAGWTLYVEDPSPKGIAIVFSALGVAMDWLRETVHGIQPTVIRLDVSAKGDSLIGSRTVTGGISAAPRSSTVGGKRTKP
jgi:hypothetical protein